MNIEVKNLTAEEMDEIRRVDVEMWREVWSDVWWDPVDQYLPRLKTYAVGSYGVYENGKLVGFTTAQKIWYRLGETKLRSWSEITGNGRIEKTHVPNGNTLYVVSLGVSDLHRGKGYGGLLIEKQKKLVHQENLEYLVLGARMPGLKNYYLEHSIIIPPPVDEAEKYAKLTDGEGRPIDLEIKFYVRHGLKVVGVLPDYEEDEASCNYGAEMIWTNLHYKG